MRVTYLVIAGANPAKAAALKRVTAILRIRCARRVSPAVAECGPTFAENARAKALAASHAAPGSLVVASDGGLEIPALGARWNPLMTARFSAGGDPRSKASCLLDLTKDLEAADRGARWKEALALAQDGRILADWTELGPQCRLATIVPPRVGAFWVDALLERCGSEPTHWQLLADRFTEFVGS